MSYALQDWESGHMCKAANAAPLRIPQEHTVHPNQSPRAFKSHLQAARTAEAPLLRPAEPGEEHELQGRDRSAHHVSRSSMSDMVYYEDKPAPEQS